MLMDDALRELVWERAGNTCEHCRLPQRFDILPFPFDHVIAIKPHGPTSAENLALSCYNDNRHKGPNIAGIDRVTSQLTRLLNPRRDDWQEHFAWNCPELAGLTGIGRTTINVLNMNLAERVEPAGRAPEPDPKIPGRWSEERASALVSTTWQRSQCCGKLKRYRFEETSWRN